MQLIGAFAGGLLFLGVAVLVFDFFAAHLIKRIYPHPEYWDEELNLPTLTPEDKRSFSRRKRLYQDAVSHRFRKWGIGLFVIGALLIAANAILYRLH